MKKNLEELGVQPVDEKPRRYKSNWLRHITRMNSNRVHKNNVELETKWTKATWKTFEETLRGGRNTFIRAQLVTSQHCNFKPKNCTIFQFDHFDHPSEDDTIHVRV
jgi:hypothetical protein